MCEAFLSPAHLVVDRPQGTVRFGISRAQRPVDQPRHRRHWIREALPPAYYREPFDHSFSVPRYAGRHGDRSHTITSKGAVEDSLPAANHETGLQAPNSV